MNDAQQAAQSIGKFLQTLRGLAELKPGLESLGSVQQAEQETKSRLSALKIDEASLISKTQQLRVEISGLEKKVEETKAKARAEVEGINAAAQTEHTRMVHETEVLIQQTWKVTNEKLDEVKGEIEEAEGRLKSLNDGCKLAQKRLDQTNAELDRIVQRARG